MSKKPLPDGAGFSSSFGDLLKARGVTLPPATAKPVAVAAVASEVMADPLDLSRLARVGVRHESKGRAGKMVTVLSGLPEPHLEALCKALKTAFGCGATVEGPDVVLQGDQTERVAPWLTAHGVRRVSRGN